MALVFLGPAYMPDYHLSGIIVSDDGGKASEGPWGADWTVLGGAEPEERVKLRSNVRGSNSLHSSPPALSSIFIRRRLALDAILQSPHRIGIRHGDFKPRNVLRVGMTYDLTAIDFASARLHHCEAEDYPSSPMFAKT